MDIFWTYYIFTSPVFIFFSVVSLYEGIKCGNHDIHLDELFLSLLVGIFSGMLNVLGLPLVYYLTGKFQYGTGYVSYMKFRCEKCDGKFLKRAYVYDTGKQFHIDCNVCGWRNKTRYPTYIKGEQKDRYKIRILHGKERKWMTLKLLA